MVGGKVFSCTLGVVATVVFGAGTSILVGLRHFGIRGDVTGICLVGIGGGVVGTWSAVLKISANVCSAWRWSSFNENGEAGDGFCRALIRSLAAWVAASAEDVFGMSKL